MSSKEYRKHTADFQKSYIEPLCQLREKGYPVTQINSRLVDGHNISPYGIEFNQGQDHEGCLLIPQTRPDKQRRIFFVNNDAQGNLNEFILTSITEGERELFIDITKKRKMSYQVLYNEGEYFDFADKDKILHSSGNLYMEIKESDLNLVFLNHSLTTLYPPFDNRIKNLLSHSRKLLIKQ
jgi:hypothetical protein